MTFQIQERQFLLIAVVCTFCTVLTNLIIHFTSFPHGSFAENIRLYKSVPYLTLNWTILFHCLLILVSMLGVAWVLKEYSRPLAILAFVFFVLFAFAEWQRILNVLWYLNGLRAKYETATDESLKLWIRYELQYDSFQSNVYFLLFTIGFTLGNFLNGLNLVLQKAWDRMLGLGLIVWSLFTASAFLVDFYPSETLNVLVNLSNKFYQPAIRFAMGIWLLSIYRKPGSR